MKKLKQLARRSASITNALVLIVATLLPILALQGTATAAQVTTRSIQMSNSSGGATGVTYHVSFKMASVASQNIQGIVVDFCDNSPIIGDTTCSALPGSFSTGTTVANQSSLAGADISTFTTVTALSHGISLTAAAPVSMTSSANAVSFDITAATNPSTNNHTFYARIYTYATAAAANGYTVANPSVVGAYVDAGGVALSTAQQITVTAKVQEQLTFCVYTGANCAAGGSTVALGDANGVLANYASAYQDASTKFDIATNAQTGAVVNLKMDTLKSGGNSIAQQGVACAADSTTTSVAQFGLRVSNVGAAPLETITGAYDCGSGNHMLDTNNTTGTTSPYGQTIADTTSQPLATTTGTVEFSAKAALTTPAGIYTTTANFIATGTF